MLYYKYLNELKSFYLFFFVSLIKPCEKKIVKIHRRLQNQNKVTMILAVVESIG